jgi:hypothetical protein
VVFFRSVRRLLVAACVVPSSPILITLMKVALGFSETSVLTRATRRNIPEDTIQHYWLFHDRENRVAILSFFSIYLWGWNGNQSTITAAVYWPLVPALDDK